MDKSKVLIELIKQDDEKTIRLVYLENKKGFLLFANRYKLNKNDILDIYQDAIIAFIENAKKGKIDFLKSNVSTYIFGIGKFMIFKKLKKEKITISENDFLNLEYIDDENDDDLKNLQIILLQEAFGKLGERCKEVLKLFYYEEKKLEEIQEKLGYSNKDVLKSQKSRCLKQLKDLTKNI